MKKFRLSKSSFETLKDIVIAILVTVLMVKLVPFTFDNIAQEVLTYAIFIVMILSQLINADVRYERRCR